MDVPRRGTIAVLIIILLTASCKTQHTTTQKEVRKEREEIVTKQNPYKIETERTIRFDRAGNIKPIEMKLNYNNVDGIVTIKDDVVKFTVEQKDTIITDRVVTEKEGITEVNDTAEFKDDRRNPVTLKGKWEKFKRQVATWSIILNVIFIGAKIMQLTRRVYMPF